MPLNARILRQLETLTLESKRKFLGQRHGLHRSTKRGQGLEFSDYRHYELGDNPRHIDWGVYGRSDKLFVKRFLEDQDLSALLVLDASGSMTSDAFKSKWLFARALAEALAYVALMSQDSVRFVVPGAPLSPNFRNPNSFYAAVKFLDELNTDDLPIRSGTELSRSLAEAASQTKFPGIALFVSDCLYPIEEFSDALSNLRARNLEIRIIQILSSEDVEPLPSFESATMVDRETNTEISVDLSPASRELYRNLLEEHHSKLEHYCNTSRIGLVRVVLEGTTDKAIANSIDELVLPTLLKTGLLE